MGDFSKIFNFDNIGGKIKNLAKWSCWITILLIWIATPILIIVAIAEIGPEASISIILFPIAAFIASVAVWIGSWTMYAFGEFVEDTHAMRNKEGTTTEVNAKREAETKAKYEAEKKMRCEAEEKARRKAEEIAKHESEMRKKLLSTKTTKTIVPMDEPNNFQNNPDWQNDIATLSDNEIYTRYIDEVEWSETYRYHCYLELKKRGLQSIQIITKHLEGQNNLKILPNGNGYVCPLCGFSNTNFSSCAQCSYNPFENPSEENNDSNDEYVDIACPKCGELLSFLKNETNGMCPNCDTEFKIK